MHLRAEHGEYARIQDEQEVRNMEGFGEEDSACCNRIGLWEYLILSVTNHPINAGVKSVSPEHLLIGQLLHILPIWYDASRPNRLAGNKIKTKIHML